MKNRNRIIPMLLYLVVLFAAFSWLSDLFGTEGNTIAYSKVIDLFRQEQVKEFLVEGDQLTMLLHTPYNGETKVTTSLSDPDGFRAEMQALFWRRLKVASCRATILWPCPIVPHMIWCYPLSSPVWCCFLFGHS